METIKNKMKKEKSKSTISRRNYIVCYDITDPKRLQKVHKICSGYGDSLQYSVFHCQLSVQDIEIMRMRLKPFVQSLDQLLFIRIQESQTGILSNSWVKVIGKPIKPDQPKYWIF